MKKTKILLVSMTALLLASCGTKKAVIQQKPVQDAEFSKKSLLDMKAGVAEDYRNLTKEVIQKDEVHA